MGIRATGDAFHTAIGVDFNPAFVNYCTTQTPKGHEQKQHYITGDACELVKLMEHNFPRAEGGIWNHARVVACVGNTIGIIPVELKPTVYRQMMELAGDNGVVIMAY